MGIIPISASIHNRREGGLANKRLDPKALKALRRVVLGKGMTRCFLPKRRPQERQSPPWVSANAPPHSSHLNETILTLAIP